MSAFNLDNNNRTYIRNLVNPQLTIVDMPDATIDEQNTPSTNLLIATLQRKLINIDNLDNAFVLSSDQAGQEFYLTLAVAERSVFEDALFHIIAYNLASEYPSVVATQLGAIRREYEQESSETHAEALLDTAAAFTKSLISLIGKPVGQVDSADPNGQFKNTLRTKAQGGGYTLQEQFIPRSLFGV